MIAKLIHTMLSRENFPVIVANAVSATTLLQQPGDFPGILVTNAPQDFLEFSATVRLLYVSGAPDPEISQLFRRCRVVRKPFGPVELSTAVKALAAL